MERIPDAPWIQNPEPYITEYYGKRVYLMDGEKDDDDYDEWEDDEQC